MRSFSVLGSYEQAKEKFTFLVKDFGYKLKIDENLNYGFTLEYEKEDIRVYLFYDYRDNEFYFFLIKGRDTKYPNDHDFENIKPFYELFEKFDETLDIYSIQPNDDDYLPALNKNSELLKIYGSNVLNGIEWI